MKIRSKISLFVIPLSVLPILLLGIFSFYSLKKGFNEQTYLDDQQISQLAADQIEQVLDNCRDALIFLSSQVDNEINKGSQISFDRVFRRENRPLCLLANNIALRYGPHLQIRFIAPNGKELFKTDGLNDRLALKNALDEEIFLQAVANGDWRFIHTFQFPPQSKRETAATTFVHRLFDGVHLKGFIFFDLDMKLFSHLLDRAAENQRGYFYLFDGKGNSLASGGDVALLQNGSLKDKFSNRLATIRNQLATTFVHFTMHEENESYTLGVRPVKEYIAFTEPIPEERWYLAVLRAKTPLGSAFQRTQRLFMLFLVISLVFAVAGTFFISKRITAPIGKLALATREFSQGKLETEITIKTRDEIGELAGDFNKMAKDLKKMMLEVDIHKNLAAIGKFAAAMYHDVKSPLEGLKFLVAGLKRKVEPENPLHKYVTEIDLGVNSLDDLIHETLQFVKPKALNVQQTGINEFLKAVVAEIDLKGRKVFWNLDDSISPVAIDRNQMKHAVLNIMNNAIEATPAGGTITISTTQRSASVRFIINDSGAGIDKNDLEKVFQPFFSTRRQGHGLGLSIVHQIIKNHEGEITIESEKGKGAKVIISLKGIERN